MIGNYVIVSWRYLTRNKLFSIINIAGLTLSLCCVMLIVLYTKDEASFDKFHKNFASLYLITIELRFSDGSSMDKFGVTGYLQGPSFAARVPEIESFTRVTIDYKDLKLGNEIIGQQIMLADPNFFETFSFPLIAGNPNKALSDPKGVVVSELIAEKYFGTTDVLNKTLMMEENGVLVPYTITGISKKCPQNSSIQFDILMQLPISESNKTEDNWASVAVNTFLKIPRGDIHAVQEKIQRVFELESKAVMEKVRADGFAGAFYHGLQPFSESHLSKDIKTEAAVSKGSDRMYSYILSAIAAFILAIACINFINLSISQSTRRAKEIGIRKVIGSVRTQLIIQFLGESFLLCFIACVAAILISQLLLPSFNALVNKELSLSYLLDIRLIVLYGTLFVLTSLAAGLYPAVVLSSYKPVQTLYGKFKSSRGNFLQKGLIVFQFTLATAMIMGTLAIFLQFRFLTTQDLGYDPNQLIKVPKRGLTQAEAKVWMTELEKSPDILFITPQGRASMVAKINGDSIYNFIHEIVDDNFLKALNLTLVGGRNFSSSKSDSVDAVLVNETFVRMAEWKNPFDEEINLFQAGVKKKVVGIVKDYHFDPLSKKIRPQMFAPMNVHDGPYQMMLIKIRPGSEAKAIPYITETFRKAFPITPFTYEFYDDINRKNYESEARWKQIIFAGTGITVFIACVGLFGLSLISIARRLKEISIRKVLGASVASIVKKLSEEVLLLLFISASIAIPAAYYGITKWLSTYPYRVEVGVWIYFSAILIVLAVALLTIINQSLVAAKSNPADALRSE